LKEVQIELAKPPSTRPEIGVDNLAVNLTAGMTRDAACKLLTRMGENEDLNPFARIGAVRLLSELQHWTEPGTRVGVVIQLGNVEKDL